MQQACSSHACADVRAEPKASVAAREVFKSPSKANAVMPITTNSSSSSSAYLLAEARWLGLSNVHSMRSVMRLADPPPLQVGR